MEFLAALPLVILVLWLAPIFPLLYVLMRWRAAGHGEPGIGSYSLVLYFRCAAILVIVAAGAALTYEWISEGKADEDVTRTAWGAITACAIFLFAHVPLGNLLAPEGDTTPAARTFGGFLLAFAGSVVFAALLWYFGTLFQKAEGEFRQKQHSDMLKASGSILVWFAGLYGTMAWAMRRE
jgi:hypothetical protein